MAMLNWRPVVDYELREIAHEQRMQQLQIEEQQRQIAHEQRMKQLESEIAQLDELNSRIDALLFNSSTSSSPPPNTQGNSEA